MTSSAHSCKSKPKPYALCATADALALYQRFKTCRYARLIRSGVTTTWVGLRWPVPSMRPRALLSNKVKNQAEHSERIPVISRVTHTYRHRHPSMHTDTHPDIRGKSVSLAPCRLGSNLRSRSRELATCALGARRKC